jgi:peptidoglycan/xylan/chitin deacetylase (PgdA/CDA1 family)
MSRAPLRNRSAGAVFLAYHSIAEDGPPFTSITPAAFERHLATLARLGYASGGSAELERLARGERMRERLAFLTFDDGYLDNGEIARPLLEAHGFRGTFFVLPPFVDDGAALSWPRVEDRVREHPAVMRSLTWATVEEMAGSGHEIGSHTLTHPTLTELGDEELRQELLDSRRRIEARTGRCDSLAYPFGLWSPRVAGAAADAGYSFAFTLPFGGQPDAGPLCIPRIAVDHRDDERRFRLKLRPAYRAFLLSRLKPAARRLLRRRPAHLSSG